MWKQLKKQERDKNNFTQKDKEVLQGIAGESENKFGYILEYMAIYSIKQALKEINQDKYFIELQHSINLTKAENPLIYRNTGELCEFDIVLLSKSGQIVFFECKSGTMSSNDGKARQYTAFATGGVYGKPVLITPLLKEDLMKIYEKYKANKVDKSEFDEYDSAILKAVRAAARGNLEIWGIDEIKERLEELYNEAIY